VPARIYRNGTFIDEKLLCHWTLSDYDFFRAGETYYNPMRNTRQVKSGDSPTRRGDA
jgi:hypothetical protein